MSRMSRGKLKKEDEFAIQDNLLYLFDELEPSIICQHLFQTGILDKDEWEEIKVCKTRRKMAEKLIDKMFHAGPDDAYQLFFEVLEKEQRHIAHKLKRSALKKAANERSPSPQKITRVILQEKRNPILEEIDRQFATIENLNETISKLSTEKEDLIKENRLLKSVVEELRTINAKLNSTIDDLKNNSTASNAEIMILKTENGSLKIKNDNLSESLAYETKNRMEKEKLHNSLLQKCNVMENESRFRYSKSTPKGNRQSISLPYSALRSVLLFKSEIDETMVKLIKTITINATDPLWQELFVFSAFWNWDLTTKYLLEMKINCNILSQVSLCPENDSTVIRNEYTEPDKYTRKMSPMMAAAANASYTSLQILLDGGADVNAKDELGDTALIYLCREDKTELQYFTRENFLGQNLLNCFDELISKGADIDVRGSEGMTSLMHCVKKGNSKYIQTLLMKVTNTKIQCKAGRTALMYATFFTGDFDSECLQQLIHESDINATDAKGDTALLYSISAKNVPVFTAIMKNEPDINIQNGRGKNALMLATISPINVFLPIILKQNPKLNEKDEDGNTALIMSAGRKNEYANLLMGENGIDLNAQNNKGETTLMIATQYRHQELVQSLIAASANVNLRDREGKTALKRARLMHIFAVDVQLSGTIKQLLEVGAVE